MDLVHVVNDRISVTGTIKTSAVLDVETKDHFWLTVFAQDHGVVPLYSSVEVRYNQSFSNNHIDFDSLFIPNFQKVCHK